MYDSHNRDCPTCGAPAGYYCNNAAGKALKTPHKARGGRDNARAMTKRGITGKTAAEQIEPYVAAPGEPPRYALHFGTINKVGVNPRSEYNTPIAVCAYPLTEQIFEQFKAHSLPFAQNDPYTKFLFLLRIKPGARVFYSSTRLIAGGHGIADQYGVYDADSARQFFWNTRPQQYDHQPRQAFAWGNKLRKMGIDVWVDANAEGILHHAEPSQVMFFNPASYEIVLSMDNPREGMVTAPRETVQPLKALIRRGIKDLRGVVLTKQDLKHLFVTDFTNVDLSGVYLEGANLKGASLTGATLTGANLKFALLTRANLKGAILTGANLVETDLKGANLSGANLKEAVLQLAVLRNADLTGADLTGANLTGANLTDALLVGADLTGADLTDALLVGADLTGADLTGADLTYAYLTDANLTGVDLRQCLHLDTAELLDVKWDASTIWPADFDLKRLELPVVDPSLL